MTIQRDFDGPEPLREHAGYHEERRSTRSRPLAVGTLACPTCDVPVAPGEHGLSPSELVCCPYCTHAARARDFLSLADPSRPARVEVRMRLVRLTTR